jgi:hypothetical protein
VPSIRLLLPVLLFAACSRPAPPGGTPPPTVALKDVRIVRSEGSQVTLTGNLDELSFRRTAGTYDGRNARFRVPGNAQTGSYEVSAPVFSGTPSEERAEGSGGVTLRTDRGLTARTPGAALDGKAGAVTGEQTITARGPGYALDADAFRLSVAGETHEFRGRVTTSLEAKK